MRERPFSFEAPRHDRPPCAGSGAAPSASAEARRDRPPCEPAACAGSGAVPSASPGARRDRPRCEPAAYAGGGAASLPATARGPGGDAATEPSFSRPLALLFAVTAGLAVGNAYAAQPLLDAIAAAFDLAPGLAGAVVTATQAGLALGLVLVVPLGDLLARRRLVPVQLVAGASALAAVALAGSVPLLLGAVAVVGASSVVAQVLVAYAASLASDDDRGRAVGLVTSGVITGILLSRTVAGAVAELGGWRAVFALSAAATLLLAALLARHLPPETPAPPAPSAPPAPAAPLALAPAAPPAPPAPLSRAAPAARRYLTLVASTFALIAQMRLLRVRGALALLTFAAFSTLWAAVALPLAAPAHALSHAQIGLFGLAGLAGALGAARAGRLADRGLGQATTGAALALLLLSWLPIAALDRSLLALAVGVVLLDLAVQAVHVTNQTLLLAAAGPARSRVTAAYMLFYSLGSALGAIAATAVYAAWGWGAVCIQGAALTATALLVWAFTR